MQKGSISEPVTLRSLLLPLGIALAGAAVNRWFSLELAFGISFLAGSPLGVLSAILAPWPFSLVGPLVALLPTVVLWAHPWALASVLLEGVMLATLARKGQLDRVILYEALYWPLIGAPLVLGQYIAFLDMRIDGALAAATKQGVNSFFAAVLGVILYYLLRTLMKRRLVSTRLPDAREYFTLFLEIGIFIPVLIGTLLYVGDRKQQVLEHAERETSIILSILASQSADTTADALSGVLGASGHYASLLDGDGVLVWSTAANPRLFYSGGLSMHRYGNAVVVGAIAESNPMKRWSGAMVRAEHEYPDGSKLVVTQPLEAQVADLNATLTTILGVLMVWLAAAAGTAYLAATLLVSPLERLRWVAEAVQQGAGEISWPSFGILEIQELRDSLVAMTGAMEKRGMDLAEAMEAAEELKKRGEKYLAFMSHELKAPIASLSAALAMEKQGHDRLSPEAMHESLSRLLELIDDILDQARSSSGTLTLRTDLFDPAHEAANLLEPFAIQARRKGLDFELYIGEVLSTTVRGDPLRFRQVIANLVSNAVKFTRTGHVSVQLTGQLARGNLVLTGTVEDTGSGIAADRLDDIWKPFSSIGNKVPDGLSSHGLGLSIVRSIVDAMSGSVELDTQEGKGSVFTFSLKFPIEDSGAEQRVPSVGVQAGGQPAADAKPDLRGVRILVADDERISRMAIGHFLRTWGATVDEVDSGDKVLEVHSSTAYSMMILDKHMPGLSGMDVIKRIRERESGSGRNRCYLVISSAESSPADAAQTDMQSAPDALLPKPVQQSALAAVLLKARLW
ncbi:MAG: hybrid sensor histidine kinase/response regulator [Clostridia bacterium]